MRKSKKGEILWFLTCHNEGCTWRDLSFVFAEKTLDRHLKALVEEGRVERTLEPRMKGQRGRQATRYRSRGRLAVRYPVMKIGSVPFFSQAINRLGRVHVRLYPEERKKAAEHRAYLERVSKSRRDPGRDGLR